MIRAADSLEYESLAHVVIGQPIMNLHNATVLQMRHNGASEQRIKVWAGQKSVPCPPPKGPL